MTETQQVITFLLTACEQKNQTITQLQQQLAEAQKQLETK